ncbi:MAG: hypothetical protein ABIA37_02280 [Candidatus Woesearchaeota archaeon]
MSVTAKKVLQKCKVINTYFNKELPYKIEKIREASPKDAARAEIILRDIVHDISEAFKDLTVTDKEIDLLANYLKMFKEKRILLSS